MRWLTVHGFQFWRDETVDSLSLSFRGRKWDESFLDLVQWLQCWSKVVGLRDTKPRFWLLYTEKTVASSKPVFRQKWNKALWNTKTSPTLRNFWKYWFGVNKTRQQHTFGNRSFQWPEDDSGSSPGPSHQGQFFQWRGHEYSGHWTQQHSQFSKMHQKCL